MTAAKNAAAAIDFMRQAPPLQAICLVPSLFLRLARYRMSTCLALAEFGPMKRRVDA
jgi:hypothetical protein